MPGPVIPTPFMMPQGRNQNDNGFLSQLLQSLVGQAGSGLIQAGINRALPYQYSAPPQQPSLEQNASMDFAEQGLRERGRWIPPDMVQNMDPNLSREEVIQSARRTGPARLQEMIAQEQAQAAERARVEALTRARNALGRSKENGPQLQTAFDMAQSMREADIDVSTVNSMIGSELPQSEADKVSLALSWQELSQMETQAEADAFATSELKRMGIVSPDAPEVVPQAGQMYEAAITAQEGSKVDWMQETVDFVLGRIGENASGTGTFPIPGMPSNAEGVTVEQAVGEARSFIERLAPANERERILKVIDSGAWERRLTETAAIGTVRQILETNPDMTTDQIRDALGDAFTKTELDHIIRSARSTFRSTGPLGGGQR